MKPSIFTFLLLGLFAFSACQQSDNLKTKKDKDLEKWNKEYSKNNCFEMVYPLVWTMPDDLEITTNDEKEMWTSIKNWYELNPEIEEKPTLIYPVNIVFKNDETQTITDEEEMVAVKKDCADKEG